MRANIKSPTQKSGSNAWLRCARELARKIADRAVAEGDTVTEIPGLRLYRRSVPPPAPRPHTNPAWLFLCRDRSASTLARRPTYATVRTSCSPPSILPVVSQVIAATEKSQSSACCSSSKCRRSARSLPAGVSSARGIRRRPRHGRRRHFTRTPGRMFAACRPSRRAQDIPFLSSLIQREIVFRLLRSPQGKHLRAIATLGEQSHRTQRQSNGSG
jgi:hypothetical protein